MTCVTSCGLLGVPNWALERRATWGRSHLGRFRPMRLQDGVPDGSRSVCDATVAPIKPKMTRICFQDGP
eukprot:9365931-Pyramimonas_sp.AAC.1